MGLNPTSADNWDVSGTFQNRHREASGVEKKHKNKPNLKKSLDVVYL